MSMMTGKIKNIRVVQFLLAVLLMTLSGLSRAAPSPITDGHFYVTNSYDKSSIPLTMNVLKLTDKTFPHDSGLSRGGLICRSDNDAVSGACPTDLVWKNSSTTSITLNFEEKRSHDTIAVRLEGYANAGCTNHALNAAITCATGENPSFFVSISETEMARFPAGIWKATLIMDAFSWTPSVKEGTITTDITLKVTDNGHADIFFPAFNTATPVVNLNLNTRPLGPGSLPAERKSVSGGAHVDLCLYDGYNTNSPWLDVSVLDPKTVANRAPDVFSIMDSSGQVDDAHRLDYKVMLSYGGQSHPMTNGQPVKLEHTDTGPARPVMLANVPGTVLCAPAALDLSVLPFANFSKAASHYSGILSVVMSANTQAP